MFKGIKNSNISVNEIKSKKKWSFSTLNGDRVDVSGSAFPVVDGYKIDGNFFPSGSMYHNPLSEPINWDGSYKRLIYDRQNFLYYKYANNPLTTFGVKNLDLEKRNLCGKITSVDIPRQFFGEKIIPKSIKISDYSFDGNLVSIIDDGNSNLILSKSFVSDSSELMSTADTSDVSYIDGAKYFTEDNNEISKEQVIELYKSGSDVRVDYSSATYSEKAMGVSYYDAQKERFGYSMASDGQYLLVSSIMDEDSFSDSKQGICSLFKNRGDSMSPIKTFRSPFQTSILTGNSSYGGSFIQTEYGDLILYEGVGEVCVSASIDGIDYMTIGDDFIIGASTSGSFYVQENADNFGSALDIHGNYGAISAMLAKNCTCDTSSYGLIFCYQRDKGGVDNWGMINVLEGEAASDEFGKSISIYNNYMVVGAPGYSNNSGSVYIFKLKTYCGDPNGDGTPTASFESNQYLLDSTGSILQGTGSVGIFDLETSPLIRNFWQPMYNKALCLSKNIDASGSVYYTMGSSSVLSGYQNRPTEIFTEYSTVPTFVSGSKTWMFDSILVGESGSRFGACVKIGKSGLVVGHDMVIPTSSAWFYINSQSMSGSSTVDNWSKFATLNRTDADVLENYPLGLDTKNESSGFGTSVSMFNEYICVGAPYDRIFGSGNNAYTIGSATIYKYSTEIDECSDESLDIRPLQKLYPSNFYESYIAYGFSCDLNSNKLIVGAPKRKSSDKIAVEFNSSGSLNVNIPTDSIYDEYLGEAYVYSLDRLSDKFLLNDVVSRKLRSGEPVKNYGHSVSIERDRFFVGGPIFSTMDSSSIYYNSGSASNAGFLSLSSSWSDITGNKMFGSVYVYNNSQGETIYVGNSFYNTGTLIITNTASLYSNIFKGSGSTGFEVEYDGQHSIYEHEYIVTIEPNEFNVSTNPSSLEYNNIPYDVNNDGIFDFNDLNLILKFINGEPIESDDVSYDSYLNLEQNSSWWGNDILLTESGDALIANALVLSSSSNKGILTQKRYDYIQNKLVNNGLLNIDKNYDSTNPLPIGIVNDIDANLLWKYWIGKLTPDYISSAIDDSSERRYLLEIVEFLNKMTGKVRPYPTKKQMLLSSGSVYSVNNGGTPSKLFENYITSSSVDISGSYLSTYITGVGLYSGGDLVVVGKLGTPIKNILTHPINISIKFDAF